MDWGNAQALETIVENYDRRGIEVTLVPRQISVSLGIISPGSTTIAIRFAVDADADFVWMGQTADQRPTAVGTSFVVPFLSGWMVRVIIVESGEWIGNHSKSANFPFADGWIPLANFAGEAGDPFYFAVPIVLKRSSRVELRGFNGGNTGFITTLTIHGYSVLETSAEKQTA